MSVTGGDAGDDLTRVDREPPQFPSVTNEPHDQGWQAPPTHEALFSPPGGGPTQQPVPAPVRPATGSGSGSGWRWAIAGAATVLVLLVVGAVLVLARPQAGAPSAMAHYVPADAATYFELRLDLPGDQEQQLAEFMTHFPGFADQASFNEKLDESLAQLLRSSNSGLDWQADVQPWFDGGVGEFGSAAATDAGTPGDMVMAVGVSDRAKLEQVISVQVGQKPVDTQEYQGFEIRSLTPPGASESVSFVVTDDMLLIGPQLESLKAALDVHAGTKPGLAEDEFFTQQLGALHGDRLATVYFDSSQMLAAMSQQDSSMLPSGCLTTFAAGAGKYVGELRAEGDHMAMSVRSHGPSLEGMPAPVNRSTDLAAAMPADAVGYLEMRQVGTTIGSGLERLLACMNQQSAGDTTTPDVSALFQQLLGSSPSDYFDFIVDAGLAVTIDGQGAPGGGIVATVDDETVARQHVERLLGLVNAFGALGSGDVTTQQVDHNGVSVTVITLPVTTPDAAISSPEFSVAVANGRLYLGMGDFVVDALDRGAGDSLAASAAYQKAISAGPSENAGLVFVDFQRLRAAAEAGMTPDERASYETEAKPFLTPITTLSLISHVDGDITVSDGYLYVE